MLNDSARVERGWVDTRASAVTQKHVSFVEIYQPHNAAVNLLRPARASSDHKYPSDWCIKAWLIDFHLVVMAGLRKSE